MDDWSPLGRLRAFKAELDNLAGGYLATIAIGGWGRGLNLTRAEFDELLDDAELGKSLRNASNVLDRIKAIEG